MSESSSKNKKSKVSQSSASSEADSPRLLTNEEVFRRPGSYSFLIKLLILALVGGAIYLASKPAFRVYKNWRVDQITIESQEKLLSGDVEGASILGRRAMQLNPRSAKANAAMARVTTRFGDASSLLFWNNAVELDKDNDQYVLEFAKCAVRFAYFSLAQLQLEGIRDQLQDDTEWLNAATGAAIGLNDFSRASAYLDVLIKKDPNNPSVLMNSASLNILSTEPEKRLQGKNDLLKLKEAGPEEFQPQVLRSLALYYSKIEENPTKSLEYREELESKGILSWNERIKYFELKNSVDPTGAKELMSRWESEALEILNSWKTDGGELNSESLEDGVGLYSLIVWRLGQSEPDEALRLLNHDKIEALDPKKFPRLYSRLYFLKAEAYMQKMDWLQLGNWLKNDIDESFEYLRSALLAKVTFEQGNPEYKTHWKLAVETVKGRSNALRTLSNMALRWGWNDEAVGALWEIASGDRNPELGLYPLVELYLGSMRDVKELRPVLERLLELYPNDQAVANDLASIDLFFEENLERAFSITERLYEADPDRIPFKALKGFALFRQGEAQKALEIFSSIPAKTINDQPSLALVMAQIEQANGLKLEALARLGSIPTAQLDRYEQEMARDLRSKWLQQ